MSENLSNHDFVEVTFEGEFGNQSPIRGEVLEVDDDPEVMSTSLMVVIDAADDNREIVYAEGVHDGEKWSNVTVRNSPITLGENATIRKLT